MRIMEALATYTAEHGYPPSQKEAAQLAGVSASSLRINYERLSMRGMIVWHRLVSRGVVVVKEKEAAVG